MPYNGTGTFNRLYSWVADANAGKVISPTEFDADGNDLAAALSMAITKDGQQVVAANIPWNGKLITNLGGPQNPGDVLSLGSTPASEITRALNYLPIIGGSLGGNQISITYDGTGLTAAVNGNTGFGRVWTANTLGAAQLNGIAGQTLYGTSNLNAAQIGNILGYTPSKNSTILAADGPASGYIANGGNSAIGSVGFTATGANLLLICNTSLVASVAGMRGTIFTNIVDNTTGQAAGNSPSTIVDIPNPGNYFPCTTICELACTIGHNYTATFYAGQNGGSGGIYVGYWHLGGING